jgi:hypothetical protein
MTRKKIIEYAYRGQIEVGSPNAGYRWVDGYSETGPDGGVLYPWMSAQDCRRDAAQRGCRASLTGR